MGKIATFKNWENEFQGSAGFMLFISVLLQLLVSSIPYSLPIYWTELTGYFDVSGRSVAVIGILHIVISLPAPLVTLWVQKYGSSMCFVLCFIGGILTPLGLIVSSFTPQYKLLYFSFSIVSGAGYMLVTLVAELIPQLWFNKNRYLATGISRSARIMGFFIWTPILRSAIDAYAWKGAALVHGGVLLNIIVIAQVLSHAHEYTFKISKYKPLSKKKSKQLPYNTTPRQILRLKSHSCSSSKENIPMKTKRIVSNKNGSVIPMIRLNSSPRKPKTLSQKFYGLTGCSSRTIAYDIMLLVGSVLVLAGYYSSVAMLAQRAESLGIKSSQANVLLPLYIGVGVASRLIFGYVGDLWFVNEVVLCGIGAALSGLFCMMSDAMISFPEQCILVILLSIVQGMYDGVWPAVFVKAFGTKWKEFAVSVFVLCVAVGKILSYLVTDWLIAETHDVNTPYIVLGAFQIIGGGVLATIAFVQLFFSQLKVTNVKDQSEDSMDAEETSLMKRVTPPTVIRASLQGEQWRDRTGSNVSQLKEFYPI